MRARQASRKQRMFSATLLLKLLQQLIKTLNLGRLPG